MTSATESARTTATRAADSKPLEYLARAGFICYGVIHLLFGWLALQVAFGAGGQESDQSGALQMVAAQPAGTFLLVVIVIGMVALAVWQISEAVIGPRGRRTDKATLERVTSGARAVVYLYLAWLGVKVLRGANASQAAHQQQRTSYVMNAAGGRLLIGVVGVLVVAAGVAFAVFGLRRKFEEHLATEQMNPAVRRTTRRLGQAGYVSKGLAYAIAGVLLVVAAVTYDPAKARGLDGAMKTIAAQSYGQWLLVVVALGIAAFGIFCFLQARYRRV